MTCVYRVFLPVIKLMSGSNVIQKTESRNNKTDNWDVESLVFAFVCSAELLLV